MQPHTETPNTWPDNGQMKTSWDGIECDMEIATTQVDPEAYPLADFSGPEEIAWECEMMKHLTKDEDTLLSRVDFKFSEVVQHPIPIGMKASLVGLILIGWPMWKMYQGIIFLAKKIQDVLS